MRKTRHNLSQRHALLHFHGLIKQSRRVLHRSGNDSFLSGSRQRRGLPNSRNSALLTLVNHEANPVLPLRRIPYLRRIEASQAQFPPAPHLWLRSSFER